ncbi:MAG: DeoR/GlpR transcriptional regulator [Gammaproteobacteria bacterium]|nr:MAG: DeoR/GlpR transcriptional regulator [Gammaproteobacteria bacterium]
MLTTHRKQLILDTLKRDGQVIAKTMSQQFGLSEDTIRRDLRELAEQGLLQRVHGGALPASPSVVDLAGRKLLATDAKTAIAKAAATLIQPKQIIILDGGTTTQELVKHLPLDFELTVVTHSPTIAVALIDHRNIDVIMLGGKLFKHSMVNIGAAAMEAISHIRADIYFMGVTGIHAELGLSTGDLEEAHIKRALCAAAAETIVMASADKINAASRYVIGPTSDVSTLVTEASVDESILKSFESLGVSVMNAK